MKPAGLLLSSSAAAVPRRPARYATPAISPTLASRTASSAPTFSSWSLSCFWRFTDRFSAAFASSQPLLAASSWARSSGVPPSSSPGAAASRAVRGAAEAGEAGTVATPRVSVATSRAANRAAVRRTGATGGIHMSFRQPPTGLADGFGTEDPYR